MSKIYEALLRAELDRVALDKDEKTITSDGVANDLDPTNSRPLGPIPAPTLLKSGSDTSFSLLRNEVSGLGRIRKTEWNPDIEHLPTIQQRGLRVEQFRSLRSHLNEVRANQPLKSVLISSALPQEGKSFIAANLALSLAVNKNSKVLLIDGDMRRYTLHKLLGCPSKPGLAEYLSGESRLLDVMQQAETAGIKNNSDLSRLEALTFIAGGDAGDKAADLSGNKRFEELLAAASPHFDWIIVDSSPINLVSDAANLARACDGVLLVANAGITKVSAAQKAIESFQAANILGFILNGATGISNMSYYGYSAEELAVK